ncbi:hypothetical protein PAXRUDRAFT_799312 [Paxillus rubicundulus Ve08.2h10]|uniref:Uncharacterized protein n=1 Tax=Paxillus rubicundulus Ve08.2h10 TaxID=930991 RepID=A0A0D0CNL1_9AGAM|nr:hypothetical protein PAXRUDRAFT_799312 [Paxillus rubicundulus Ve08.2h10]
MGGPRDGSHGVRAGPAEGGSLGMGWPMGDGLREMGGPRDGSCGVWAGPWEMAQGKWVGRGMGAMGYGPAQHRGVRQAWGGPWEMAKRQWVGQGMGAV